ncbi:hypothetical protein [Saccharicrinis fermentans]|uniref:hypothetical protein n=1 Tax=Saccharicrinis fermentans TaxID=982 RepID=UPI00048761A3|nr:hypothetical protein [Saccharicrinis fermentans]
MHKINEIVYHDCQRAFDTFASFNTRTNTSACSYYEKAIYDKETIYAKVLGFLSTGLDVKKYHEGDDSKKSFVNAKSDEEMFNDFYHGNGSFHITINKGLIRHSQ